ncbi:coiled-coil domain-containing protein, partial [Colwellia ponticola]
VFIRGEQITDNNEQLNGLNEQITDNNEQLNGLNEQITDNNEQLNGLNEQITERQRVILHFVEKSPSATYDDMARAAGVSSATVRRDAEILIGCGLLKRVGSRKAGHWEVRGEKNHDIR